MALKYGFFDAAYDEQTGTYDRQYLSSDMSDYFGVIVGNGVFKKEGDALEVIPSGDGMNIVVSTGFATARGRYLNNTEPYTIELEESSSYPRIDIIVARMSTFQNERDFKLIVRTGSPSEHPTAPSIVRNEGVYELCLAKINIPANVSTITSGMIEDTRDDNEICGYVSGLGGGAEFIDCTINSGVDVYSSAWLLDANGDSFQPEAKKVYRVLTSGEYENCIYIFDVNTNKYIGVGSYNIELSDEEVQDLWSSSSHIRLENIPAPVATLQYNGQVQSPTWLYYDPTKLRIGGVTSASDVGVYYATFEPINGYSWSDGTVTVKSIMWTINKKFVPIPIPIQTQFNYDGTEKTVVFNNLDTDSVTITNASAINTGVYTVTATLNDPLNCSWQDDTTAQKAWSYAIAGMQNTVTLSKSSVKFNSSSDYDTVIVSSSSGGSITVESTNENIVHAEVNGSVITLTPGSSAFSGTASVLVIVEGTSIYEPGVATITANKNYGMTVVSWADGTDEEIVALVQAADRGELDLRDVWHVGDEREVYLSAIPGEKKSGSTYIYSGMAAHQAQTNKLVLMDTDHYTLETPVLDKYGRQRTRCSFVVGLKHVMLENDKLESNDMYPWLDTTITGNLRIWCSKGFADAIPSTLLPAFKNFVVNGVKIWNSSNNETVIGSSNELFSIFGEGEIFDTRLNSSPEEFGLLSQIEYFKTAENRKKTIYGSTNGSKYLTRSQIGYYDSGRRYHCACVNNEGTSTIQQESTEYGGIAPFGVI